MLKNYFVIAWRNVLKYRVVSAINIFGLTIGLACCLLLLTYILNEVSYDKFQPAADRTFRLSRSFHNEDGIQSLHLGAIAPPFGPLLQAEFPEIQSMTRLLSNGNTAFVYDDKKFYERRVFFADEHIGDVFRLNMVKGNAQKALEAPFQILITDELATKYFGTEDPINKLVKLDNGIPVKVAGVYKPFPSNTHLHPDVLISFNTLKDSTIYGAENLRTNWGNNSFLTYVVLADKQNAKPLEAKFPAFINKYFHFPDEPPGFVGSKFTHLYLTPLTDIHLRSHLDYEVEENGDIKRVYIFSVIALFILLIACINYMNLSTARSVLRAREIGIRKTIGASRNVIIAQFLAESVLLTCVSMILAFAVTALLLPWLNKVSGQELQLSTLLQTKILLPLLLAPFVIGLLSGLYPALFMSSFKPVKVLKGLFKINGNLSLRKVLVVVQFAISIILIVSTVVVFRQLRYMQNKALGYDKEQIITLSNTAAFGANFESFRNELLRNNSVKNIARSSRIPSGRLLDAMDVAVPSGDTVKGVSIDLKFLSVDYNFAPTYNMKLVAGRNYSATYSTDSSAFLINETAVRNLGWRSAQDAINKELIYGGQRGRVIGVLQDFYFESLHQRIPAMLLRVASNNFNGISIKLSGNNLPLAIAAVENTWKQFLPETPFSYTFLDERFETVYQSEQRQKTLFTAFACVAIFIACLGLFGLSAFTISQRLKEIGIRKILGADTNTIVQLLSTDFLKLVIIAAVIAFPVAWYAMHNWLEDFAYRTGMPWWVFVLAGVLSAMVAFATISFQAVRAARSNPVKNLRTE